MSQDDSGKKLPVLIEEVICMWGHFFHRITSQISNGFSLLIKRLARENNENNRESKIL
jgi:hypothetical protein